MRRSAVTLAVRGLARQPHTSACGERFRELMKDDAKKKLPDQKRAEYDRRWEDKMCRRIARKEERHVEEDVKKRRSESSVIKVPSLKYRQCTINVPLTYHSRTIHGPFTYHLCTIHVSLTCHSRASMSHQRAINVPLTYHSRAINAATTYHSRTSIIPFTYH